VREKKSFGLWCGSVQLDTQTAQLKSHLGKDVAQQMSLMAPLICQSVKAQLENATPS